MATKKPPYSAKVKFWMPTFSGDLEGGMQGCAIEIFNMLPVDQQSEALKKMQANHISKTDRERQKAEQV
ncbi:hypothetical protein [Erwinia rhapontici]|uniref:hypothetical protein n=1 Tax=Erwinia rhapontici TaxID=55212 RepID=UPI00133198EE|nr:hypothetical protein [Erwinia rhapontici]MBP2157154.1 hypothetical protein [Erwinia rhapontici]